MQKGFTLMVLLVGVLILLAVVGGGYYVGKIVNTPPHIVPVITPTPKPIVSVQPVSTPNETANWKTYTDSQAFYSFQYPDVGIKKEGVNGVAVGLNYLEPQTEDVFQKAFYLVVGVEKNSSNVTLEQIMKELNKKKLNIKAGSYYEAGNIRPYTNGQISGLIYQEYYDNGDQTSGETKIVSLHNGYKYIFTYSNLGQTVSLGGEKIVQQILSTFKFLDSNQSNYTCPEGNGWVNCMPILTEEAKKACTSEAINWYKANCPNFQGVAQ